MNMFIKFSILALLFSDVVSAGRRWAMSSNPGITSINLNSGDENELKFTKYWDYQDNAYQPERKRSHKRRRKLKPPKGPKPKYLAIT